MMNFNKMNKKCYNNSMNSYQLKVIHLKKSQIILENVEILFLEGIEIEGKKKSKIKKIIDIKGRKKIFLSEIIIYKYLLNI